MWEPRGSNFITNDVNMWLALSTGASHTNTCTNAHTHKILTWINYRAKSTLIPFYHTGIYCLLSCHYLEHLQMLHILKICKIKKKKKNILTQNNSTIEIQTKHFLTLQRLFEPTFLNNWYIHFHEQSQQACWFECLHYSVYLMWCHERVYYTQSGL